MELHATNRYEVLLPLAKGGMAELHLARMRGHERFEKIVVLKSMLPELVVNRDLVDLFLDEARLAATLHHANIAQVYDVGLAARGPFFAMEFVHGQDLRALTDACRRMSRSLSLDEAVSIVIGLCAGLHYAHERVDFDGRPLGIVHRDVSPSNVLVSYDGSVKIVDFGIAKAATRSAETREGELRGKFGYMSPEQCLSSPIDRRSDVYNIAILLFELSTGSRLYQGANGYERMKRMIEDPTPRPGDRRADYPPELERIVCKGLEKDRDRRYATAEELQIELEAFARDQKLAISGVTLARCMRELFSEEIEGWASAQRRGLNLAEHLGEARGRQTQTAIAAPAAIVADLGRAALGKRSARWPAAIAVVGLLGMGAAALWRQQGSGTVATSAPAAVPVPASERAAASVPTSERAASSVPTSERAAAPVPSAEPAAARVSAVASNPPLPPPPPKSHPSKPHPPLPTAQPARKAKVRARGGRNHDDGATWDSESMLPPPRK